MNSSGQKLCKILDGPVGIVEQEDIISQLPDDLLHYILSFVEIVDAVRLSVLSKRWRYLWITMPFLDFDIIRLAEAGLLEVDEFRNFINWVLIYQGSSSLTRFRLCCGFLFGYEQVMRWVRIAAWRNVQELEIRFDPSQASENFELPYCISISQCLRVLKLNLSRHVLRLPSNVNLRQLKSLELECVNLTDEFLMPTLLSRCSLLENLSLSDCILHRQVLCIASASLKCLEIKYYTENEVDREGFCASKLEVSCPNLFSFSYDAPKPKRLTLSDLSSLEIMCLDFDKGPDYDNNWHEDTACLVFKILKEAENIRSLSLKTDAMASLLGEVDRLKCHKITFSRLKSLTLSIGMDARYTQPMFLFLKNCPTLELLTIVIVELSDYNHNWHWQLDDEKTNDERSNWWKHHLKSVHLVGFVDYDDDINFAEFILKNGLVLEKFNIIWMDERSVATEKLVLGTSKASSIVAVKFFESSTGE